MKLNWNVMNCNMFLHKNECQWWNQGITESFCNWFFEMNCKRFTDSSSSQFTVMLYTVTSPVWDWVRIETVMWFRKEYELWYCEVRVFVPLVLSERVWRPAEVLERLWASLWKMLLFLTPDLQKHTHSVIQHHNPFSTGLCFTMP